MKQSNESNSAAILGWVQRLATHFAATLEEEQIDIFTNALSKNSVYQIDVAFERCLNECQFMPKLRELHEKMPADREPVKTWNFSQQRPIVDEIREVGRKLFLNYDRLEGKDLHDAAAAANAERYRRMGVAFRVR